MDKTIKISLGKTIGEWNERFGQSQDLWSFPYVELLDGTIEPNPDILYWAIGDRLYETTDNAVDLRQISTKEIKAEIGKRGHEARLEREKQRKEARRCYNCKYYGTVSQFGIPMPRPAFTKYGSFYCPFIKSKRDYGRHNQIPRCQIACEHFEHINEGTTL